MLLLLPPGSLQIYDLTHYHKQSESERTQRGNEAKRQHQRQHTAHNTLVMWQHLIMPQKLKFMRRHQPLLPYSLSSDKFMDWLCPLHGILLFHLPLLFSPTSSPPPVLTCLCLERDQNFSQVCSIFNSVCQLSVAVWRAYHPHHAQHATQYWVGYFNLIAQLGTLWEGYFRVLFLA